MMDEPGSPTWNWNRPQNVINIRKQRVKKRALQGRLYLDESPSKKKARKQVKKFQAEPPPIDDETNEDSTLMELLCMEPTPPSLNPSLSHSLSISSNSVSSTSPVSLQKVDSSDLANLSPLHSYLACAGIQKTPTTLKIRRQLIPTPVSTSPSTSSLLSRRIKDTTVTGRKEDENYWHEELCQDWSIKTGLRIISNKSFGWTCNNLKLLEESSGTSAFVRCIDRDLTSSSNNSSPSSFQLDGLQFIGAQFHQCCLYWQFPYLHETSLFPRNSSTSSNVANDSSIRYGDKRSDQMYSDWVDAFRSAFHLIRARQSPYFYMITNQFTCLFSAAGLQGNEDIQVSITPSTSSFRETLKSEGIAFSMPYVDSEEDDAKSKQKADLAKGKQTGETTAEDHEKESDVNSDDEDVKWLDDLGVSQNLNLSTRSKISPATVQHEKSKTNLVVIVGSKDTLTFFNFLLNSKQHVMTSSGYLSGIPTTIISPIAFLGSSLRSLKLKSSKSQDSKGNLVYFIDMHGPILPHVIHMLTTLLVKTIEEYKIQMTTLPGSNFLNFLARKGKPKEKSRPSAFHLQSLTDCGLGKNILDIFCRDDNVGSILTLLECKNGLFQWK